MLYKALHEEKNFPYAYASVYTQRNGKAVPIAEDVYLSAEAGGPMDEVGILEEEGKLHACAHWENGESWGVPTRSWGGKWYLYQISGAEGELTAYVDFSGDLSSETGLFVSGDFTRNGVPMSTDDYNQWRQSIRWISCIHTPYYSIAAESNYRVKTLSDLLKICNGSPDTGCNGGEACPGKDFVDMPATTNWAHDGIDFAFSEGLFLGTDAKHFSPNGTMTRGIPVTVLWRLDGKPTVTCSTPFSDVKNSMYYAQPIIWASYRGAVKGVGNRKFDPEGKVTREELAVIMLRYAAMKGYVTNCRALLTGFYDYARVSDWAKVALSWANADKLVNGAEENGKLYLQPAGSATRAQVAAILMRYVQNVVNWSAPTETESRTSAFTKAAQKLENSDLQGAWDLYDGYVSDLIDGRGDCYFWSDGYATGYACDVGEYSYIYAWNTASGNVLQIGTEPKAPSSVSVLMISAKC